MNESALKNVMRRVYFKPGAVRTIRVGPMRGLRFRVSDVTGMSPWYSGAERGHQRVFQKFARAGCVAMDIGANWGLHTLYLSRLVGEQGKVVAVECNPRVFAELQWHVEQNGCGNVTALPLAMSDADGQALFAFGPDSYTGHLESVSEQRTAQSTIPVTTSTVDNVVSRLGLARLDLVKIDVEGAEGKVLAGAERTAAALRPAFVIDLHNPEQDRMVGHWLIDHGYHLFRLSGSPILRVDAGYPNPEGVWGSILGLPASRA